ncbi:MAG TPA: hypothetical protein VMT67_13725 [Terriglobales bacterium]|nr:hypothetical protein [Terriglobales bacterium]
MTQIALKEYWHDLYREALMESDPAKSPLVIEEAYRAAQRRALELWNARSPETKERHELDAALYFLGLLRMAAREESRSSRPVEILRSVSYES